MEHRLIQGGEQFLPFARSTVAKLKKLGLPYADQSYEIDGVSIKVRIEPGHEYIRIEGGKSHLKMDSGVVELFGGIDVESPDSYAPRLLHETSSVGSYNTPFIDTELSPGFWRLNPSIGNTGQFSGDLTLSGLSVRGAVPQDASTAASFAPQAVTTPSGIEYKTDDANVWSKKIMANTCPASMFTGKCRLYVQAMYGAHMYDQATDGHGVPLSEGKDNIPRFLTLGGRTYLLIEPHTDATDTNNGTTYMNVALTASSGVRLDKATGKHYLFIVGTNAVDVYPLVGNSAAEAARRLLKKMCATLPADDPEIDKLEAYILSSCQPYARLKVQLGIAYTPNYSMGYGWHWNWSGTGADIAINTQEGIGFEGGFDRYGMVSVHYHLGVTLTHNDDGTVSWFADVSTVSGPEHWAVMSIIWSVHEPEWGSMTSTPTTPWYGSYREGAGTFYVFYLRDEIQICRIVITRNAGDARREVSDWQFVDAPDPGSIFRNPGTVISEFTVGDYNGWCNDYTASAEYFVAVVKVGGRESKPLHNSWVSTYRRVTTENKTLIADPGPTGGYDGAYSGEITLRKGYPINFATEPTGSPTWVVVHTGATFDPGPGGVDSQAFTNAVHTYDRVDALISETRTSEFTAIIPAFDAEAIYIHTTNTTTPVSNYKTTENRSANLWKGAEGTKIKDSAMGYRTEVIDGVTVYIPTPYWPGGFLTGTSEVYYKWGQGHLGTILSTSTDTSLGPVVSEAKSLLVCRAGALEATIDGLAYYHAPDDAPMFSVWSGAKVDNPTVFSPGHVTPVGTETLTNPVLVGWV